MRSRPLVTFLSYAHVNRRHREKLRQHVAQLEREELIRLWDDEDLPPGKELDTAIQKKLEESEVFILLVSPEFIASDYCSRIEMTHALERHRSGNALVLPVILSPCDWKFTALARLVVAPRDGKPISTWTPRDAGWADATERLRAAIQQFREADTPRPHRTRWMLGAVAAGIVAMAAGALVTHEVSLEKAAPDAAVTRVEASAPVPVDARQPSPLPRPPLIDLVVESSPPATVALYSGGKLRERQQSPLRTLVAPGPIELEVSGTQTVKDEHGRPCSGEVPFLKRESFTVPANPSARPHTVRLERGTLLIKSVPASHVAIEGVRCGDVPLQLTLYEGTYTATFECDPDAQGCANRPNATRSFQVKPGASNHAVVYRWP